MIKGYYSSQASKLNKAFIKYLRKLKGPLNFRFGHYRSLSIINEAKSIYPDIIGEIPYYQTPMYDKLVIECSRILAVKKAMRKSGIGIEEFIEFYIFVTRTKYNRVPKTIRKFAGKLFLSELSLSYLKRVGRSASANGWPTEFSRGGPGDDFDIKLSTKDCGMVKFIKAVGEEDLIPYCSFFDFTAAELMGIGISQISTIDSGECIYTMSRKGNVEWPENIQTIFTINS